MLTILGKISVDSSKVLFSHCASTGGVFLGNEPFGKSSNSDTLRLLTQVSLNVGTPVIISA